MKSNVITTLYSQLENLNDNEVFAPNNRNFDIDHFHAKKNSLILRVSLPVPTDTPPKVSPYVLYRLFLAQNAVYDVFVPTCTLTLPACTKPCGAYLTGLTCVCRRIRVSTAAFASFPSSFIKVAELNLPTVSSKLSSSLGERTNCCQAFRQIQSAILILGYLLTGSYRLGNA